MILLVFFFLMTVFIIHKLRMRLISLLKSGKINKALQILEMKQD